MPESAPFRKTLEDARKELLELSTRNRLLNTPRHSSRARTIEVVDELADEIFRLLVVGGKSMTFLPAEEAPEPAPANTEGR